MTGERLRFAIQSLVGQGEGVYPAPEYLENLLDETLHALLANRAQLVEAVIGAILMLQKVSSRAWADAEACEYLLTEALGLSDHDMTEAAMRQALAASTSTGGEMAE